MSNAHRLAFMAGPDEALVLDRASDALALGAQPADVAAALAVWAEKYPDLIGTAGPTPAVPVPDCCLDCGGPVEAETLPGGQHTVTLHDGIRRMVWRCLRGCEPQEEPPTSGPWSDALDSERFTACTALVPWQYGGNVQVGCLLEAGHPGDHLPAPF